MGYITDHLTEDERVAFLTRQHWITAVPLPLLCYVLAGVALWFRYQYELPWVKYVSYVFFGVGTIIGLRNFIRVACTEFGVTTKRVIIKTGVISRKTQEVILQKVESIAVNQSIGGRILGYGTIVITGSGGSNDAHKNIAHPLEFRQTVQEQIQRLSEHD